MLRAPSPDVVSESTRAEGREPRVGGDGATDIRPPELGAATCCAELAGTGGRFACRHHRLTRGRLRETAVVDVYVHADSFPGVLSLVRARTALRADREREGEQHALDFLVVPELHLERALGAAHRALHLVLDRHARLGVEVVRAHVAVARERDLQLVDVRALDLVGADQLDLVALLLVVEERIVELRVLDDPLGLILAERLGVLLARPRLDLPAARSVVRVDAGHAAERELLAHLVRALVLVGHVRLEAAAAIELSAATHRLDGPDAIGAADPLGVPGDDFVRRLAGCARRDEEGDCEKGKQRSAHCATPLGGGPVRMVRVESA